MPRSVARCRIRRGDYDMAKGASWRWVAGMAFLVAGVSARPVRGVVIDRLNAGSANMTAPADDPGPPDSEPTFMRVSGVWSLTE